MSILHISI